ncbi:MAG: DMT family transporter [Bacteroidales bacterium]|nr:DMT family transporter [Bacteroidales bacterium]
MTSSGKIKSDMLLLLAAAIWGFAFVAQRVGMDFVGPFTFSAVRFGLGCLVLIPFLFFRKHLAFNRLSPTKFEKKKIIWLQILLGLLVFGGVSFQQYGLVYTTAGDAGFITGLYVVFVPVAGLFLGQRNHIAIWIGVVLALTGLYFLSVREGFVINFGDYLVFVCAIIWTAHVLVVGHVAPRTDPIRTAIIQFAICSLLSWIIAIVFEEIQLGPILEALWPILYGGVLSVGIGYTLQVVAQQKAHPAYASIILSMESVFAVLGGWLLLGEEVTWKILLGCGLMLTGMIVAQAKGFTGSSSVE